MEVFPTCVRQSGIGIATFVSTMISIGGPYVIYLGMTDLKLPYATMFLVCFIGSISASLLPETAGKSLPETLSDAEAFGKNEKFFSWQPPQKRSEVDEEGGKENGKAKEAGDEEEKKSLNPDKLDPL